MTFIGRRKELQRLETLYVSDDASTCAIYGRRRVGKTALIREFCKDKCHMFLTSTGITPESMMHNLSEQLSRFKGETVTVNDAFELVESMRSSLDREGIVLIIDEFPYLAKFFPDVVPLLQGFIDHDLKDNRAMLILCGSSMSAMIEYLNDGDSPLFMRFPIQMKISPMGYPEARLLHPGYSEEDRIRAYCIAGGIPLYHQLLDGESLKGKVDETLLSESGLLGAEAKSVFSLELKPWDAYARVLAGIGERGAEIGDIIDRSGLSKTYCMKLMNDMLALGVVEEVDRYGGVRRRTYVVSDGLLSFYYGVVVRNEGIISLNPNGSYDALKQQIDTFYGHRFEQVCKQYIVGTRTCRWIGRWWGTVPVRRNGVLLKGDDGKQITESTDVDIVAISVDGPNEKLVLCECKFTTGLIGEEELRDLTDRGETMRKGDRNKRYILFARSGFTRGLEELIEENGTAELVDLDSLKGWAESAVRR